jgi:hypothetical protein
MRLAIVHSFPGLAEEQAAGRIAEAAERMGLDPVVLHGTEGIDAQRPDLVLCLSHHEGKTTAHPTYGVVMAPLAWYDHDTAAVERILSYDGHLTTSAPLAGWLRGLLAAVSRPPLIGRYTNTLPSTAWIAPSEGELRLAYLGTNWDGWRHWGLFDRLARRPYMRFHGPAESWRHVDPAAYGGALPFDRTSVLDAYRRAGAGLALDRPDFGPEDLPSQRIYEITASGAVAIAGDLPFVRAIYGDTLLYVDRTATPSVLVRQIDAHMDWIASDRVRATEMARAAHAVFERELALERLLPAVLDLHARAQAAGPAVRRPVPPRPPQIARPEIVTDLLEGGTLDLAPGAGTTVAADAPPFGRSAVLEIHLEGTGGPDPRLAVTVGDGVTHLLPENIPMATIGNVRRARLPLSGPVPAGGAVRIASRSPDRPPVRVVGLALRQADAVPVVSVTTLPPGYDAWIVGAAQGGTRLAGTLDALCPGVRLAGFVDDFVTGPVLDRPVLGMDAARDVVRPGDLLLVATQHWPGLWPRLLALGAAAVHAMHPGDGTGIVQLWPPTDQGAVPAK